MIIKVRTPSPQFCTDRWTAKQRTQSGGDNVISLWPHRQRRLAFEILRLAVANAKRFA